MADESAKSDQQAGGQAGAVQESFRRLAEIDTDGVLQYKADFG